MNIIFFLLVAFRELLQIARSHWYSHIFFAVSMHVYLSEHVCVPVYNRILCCFLLLLLPWGISFDSSKPNET